MEKKIFIIGLLLVAMMLHLQGQVPQKFSYQAVIRNADGTVMASQSVDIKISLRKTSLTGDIVYSETFNEVLTNAQGVISLSIGGGTVLSGVFASIPWGENIFIQVDEKKTTESTYLTIGATQILSVPYALYAGSVSQVVSQPNAAADDPIFVVKNKDGKIVFAVYQTGVKIYVEDSPVKGAKGGFAVGGLSNQSKGAIARDILFVNPDSTRINFNDNIAKGAKGGFAVGGLSNQSKSDSKKDYFKVTQDSTYFSTTILSTADIITTGNVNTGAGTTSEPLVDIDGNSYQTVKIGNQIWMNENLQSTHYSDGTKIDSSAIFYYDSVATNLPIYGMLYSGTILAQTTQNVCPDGWHVPSSFDWDSLFTSVGGPYYSTTPIITGLKLMEKGIVKDASGYWSYDVNANNASGFSARPGGYFSNSSLTFNDLNIAGYWWSINLFSTYTTSMRVYLNGTTGEVGTLQDINSSDAYSIRCVKGSSVIMPGY